MCQFPLDPPQFEYHTGIYYGKVKWNMKLRDPRAQLGWTKVGERSLDYIYAKPYNASFPDNKTSYKLRQWMLIRLWKCDFFAYYCARWTNSRVNIKLGLCRFLLHVKIYLNIAWIWGAFLRGKPEEIATNKRALVYSPENGFRTVEFYSYGNNRFV